MSTKTVLAICDNDERCGEYQEIFHFAEDYDLETITNPDEAISLLKNSGSTYCLFILDVQETPASNLELLKRLKKISRTQKIMVVTSDKRQTLEIMIRGAIDIIFRPFDKFDLLHRIDDLMKDMRACKRFELKDCDIKIVLLNQDGVRLRGVINNICLDGILIEIDDLDRAREFFKGEDAIDVLFQPSADEPLVKIFRGNVVRIFKDQENHGEMAIYLTPERDIDFLDDFVNYFKVDLDKAV